jgi:hypothetical protein
MSGNVNMIEKLQINSQNSGEGNRALTENDGDSGLMKMKK